MRLERAFRLLDHVTLAAAGVCLIYAEQPFLPSLPVCLVPFFGLVLAASRAQGRWVLPAWAANLLGLFIGAATTWWLVLQLRTPGVWTFETPVPVSLVPHLGPLLMALLLVKLFRPRGRNDFWLLQGIGLLQVGLGCVLASGPWFGALLLVYLACALACLTLHYHYWGQREARPSDCGLPIADCGFSRQSAIRNPQSAITAAVRLAPRPVLRPLDVGGQRAGAGPVPAHAPPRRAGVGPLAPVQRPPRRAGVRADGV